MTGDAGAPAPRVVTVGHSTHPIESFIALLRGAGVTDIVDVRRLPGSRRNPQFDAERLGSSLEAAGIGYSRDERLGGRRGPSRDIPPETNGHWEHASFHRYADYALGADFRAGISELIAGCSLSRRPAVMCAEAVWWRCHRRIIADHLLARGVPVVHLMPGGRLDAASLTPGAVPHPDGAVTYPRRTAPAAPPA